MSKFLKKYNEIMEMYRGGDFGSSHLTMREILEKAGAPDLFNEMNLSEIQHLIDHASGMTKKMFFYLKEQREINIIKLEKLEKELASYNIKQYCDSDNISDAALAKKLNLEVQYLERKELPKDVEATLSPTEDKNYFGVIKVLKNCDNKFPYMHEIMHYFRDVGVGNKVRCEYTRKRKGKTDCVKEQEINYLTAATVMPIEKVVLDLDEYECVDYGQEKEFFSKMAEKYKQDIRTVTRRFIEVRSLVDCAIE